jgi:multicomponent K+:H+ antiporter subunit E
MLRLFARVVAAMLRSNAAVARIILTRASRDIPSGFVSVPLDLKDANGLAVLAMIITFTPGTVWVQLSADRRRLLIHVLAIDDEAALVEGVKRRYERPLMEIFE